MHSLHPRSYLCLYPYRLLTGHAWVSRDHAQVHHLAADLDESDLPAARAAGHRGGAEGDAQGRRPGESEPLCGWKGRTRPDRHGHVLALRHRVEPIGTCQLDMDKVGWTCPSGPVTAVLGVPGPGWEVKRAASFIERRSVVRALEA